MGGAGGVGVNPSESDPHALVFYLPTARSSSDTISARASAAERKTPSEMWWMPGDGKWSTESKLSSQQSMSSILTCSNDRQAGTREDVRIVALAWLVSLQRNKEIDFHRIYWQRISFQLTKIANGIFSYLAKALEVWEGRTWGKQSPTIGVGVRLGEGLDYFRFYLFSTISFFHINRSVTSSAVHSAMLVGLDRAKMIGTSLKLQKELCNFDVHSRWHNSNLHNIDEFNT